MNLLLNWYNTILDPHFLNVGYMSFIGKILIYSSGLLLVSGICLILTESTRILKLISSIFACFACLGLAWAVFLFFYTPALYLASITKIWIFSNYSLPSIIQIIICSFLCLTYAYLWTSFWVLLLKKVID